MEEWAPCTGQGQIHVAHEDSGRRFAELSLNGSQPAGNRLRGTYLKINSRIGTSPPRYYNSTRDYAKLRIASFTIHLVPRRLHAQYSSALFSRRNSLARACSPTVPGR